MQHLSKLSAHRTRQCQTRVRVRHERSGIRLDHADMEAFAGVLAINHDTSDERTLQTSNTVAHRSVRADRFGVGKRDPRWSGSATSSFVNMRRCGSWGFEIALEVLERDVVADHVHGGVDTEVEGAGCARKAPGGFCAVDNLARNCVNGLHRAKSEQLVGVESCRCSGVLTEIEADLDCDDTVARTAKDWGGGCAER
jgi:hypothetical protein